MMPYHHHEATITIIHHHISSKVKQRWTKCKKELRYAKSTGHATQMTVLVVNFKINFLPTGEEFGKSQRGFGQEWTK
jgi:hypothetical protein